MLPPSAAMNKSAGEVKSSGNLSIGGIVTRSRRPELGRDQRRKPEMRSQGYAHDAALADIHRRVSFRFFSFFPLTSAVAGHAVGHAVRSFPVFRFPLAKKGPVAARTVLAKLSGDHER